MINKYLFLTFSYLVIFTKLHAQTETTFVYRDPIDKIETIRFKWIEGQKYSFITTSKTLNTLGKDTTRQSQQIDSLNFTVLKTEDSLIYIQFLLTTQKQKDYFLSPNCKTDQEFNEISPINIDLLYDFQNQNFTLINCTQIKEHAKKIFSYNIDCSFEESIDQSIYRAISENIEKCSSLTNWFSINLQFIFNYDGYPYPAKDSIHFTIESITKDVKPNEEVNKDNQEQTLENIDKVHLVTHHVPTDIGNKKYVIKEDENYGPSSTKKWRYVLLETYKEMMGEERYQKELHRIKSIVDDHFETILLAPDQSLISIYKRMSTIDMEDGKTKHDYYEIEYKKL